MLQTTHTSLSYRYTEGTAFLVGTSDRPANRRKLERAQPLRWNGIVDVSSFMVLRSRHTNETIISHISHQSSIINHHASILAYGCFDTLQGHPVRVDSCRIPSLFVMPFTYITSVCEWKDLLQQQNTTLLVVVPCISFESLSLSLWRLYLIPYGSFRTQLDVSTSLPTHYLCTYLPTHSSFHTTTY